MNAEARHRLPAASILVPVLDADGNTTGGVRLPDAVAALGTHAAQNPPLTTSPAEHTWAYHCLESDSPELARAYHRR